MENILENMEKHINKPSPRVLSLYGRVILLNTLITSKTSYLSNIFPLDAIITYKIHKKYSNTFGITKSQNLSQEKQFSKKQLGGLNLI